ncbi:hypothetical protein ACZ11_05200 [Lysinibacillus xylanilyticus]|uniref:ABC transporter permease n=1 Tax=Lysinibacillus xylanilyticus TaxID=582475 RepID=A0A0K9FBX2_9BACI|nr:FtsX-like permease family protein [Lysinibacillus xylanilyticus]KMY31611.1 hypothetical protein ACZ11_05200 [Lysinibacillus xylanilyticus]
MSTIFKYISRNLLEKKLRSFIVIFSIMISTSLFFASTSISDVMINISMERMKQYAGTSDITMKPTDSSPNNYITVEDIEVHEHDLEYSITAIESSGQFKHNDNEIVNFNVMGYTLDELETMNTLKIIEEKELHPFVGNKIIINRDVSEKMNLALGDTMEIKIGSEHYTFLVSGIAEKVGLFRGEGLNPFAVVPKEHLGELLNLEHPNVVFLKVKDKENLSSMISTLSESYKDYIVEESISDEAIEQQVSGIAVTFLLMTIVVSIISMFIIYSSFKAITMERLTVMGTFRSLGATRKMTNLILLLESVFYGLISGVLGCVLGVGILFAMSMVLAESEVSTNILLAIQPLKLLFTFLLALILCILSSIIPILKVSKISVKDIILNNWDNSTQQSSKIVPFVGVLFVLFALIAPPLLSRTVALPLGIISAILLIVGIIFLIPVIMRWSVKLFSRPFSHIFGNEGQLALKNLRQDKNVITNISILSIAIATILMINIIGYGVVLELNNYYDRTPKYDVMMTATNMDEEFLQSVKEVEGVADVYGVYYKENVAVVDKNSYIGLIESADKDQFMEFWNFDIEGDSKALIEELDEGHNIILSLLKKNQLGVEVGDSISLKIKDVEQDYRVIGFMNTSRNSANYGVVSEKNLIEGNDDSFYSIFYIKSDMDSYELQKKLNEKYVDDNVWTMTMKEAASNDMKNSEQQFTILKSFSVLSLLIGGLSIINNLVISFIQRRRSTAILRSVGMSKGQFVKITFVESLFVGMIGGIVGIIGGLLLINIVPHILQAIDQRVVIHFSTNIMLVSFLAAIAVTVITSISPALKASKISVVEVIKTE